MFEHAYRCGIRYGSRVLLGVAAAILVLEVLLSVVRFMQIAAEAAGGRLSYNTPFTDWFVLVTGVLSAVKDAAVPFVAAIVLERIDRWLTERQSPGNSN